MVRLCIQRIVHRVRPSSPSHAVPTRSGFSLVRLLQPFDNVVLISAAKGKDGDETLFQLPRTDTFLRAFAKMAYVADQALHDLLDDMERLAKQRKPMASL